jgi:hypothetical protein
MLGRGNLAQRTSGSSHRLRSSVPPARTRRLLSRQSRRNPDRVDRIDRVPLRHPRIAGRPAADSSLANGWPAGVWPIFASNLPESPVRFRYAAKR